MSGNPPDDWNEDAYGLAWLPMFAAQAGVSVAEMAERMGVPKALRHLPTQPVLVAEPDSLT